MEDLKRENNKLKRSKSEIKNVVGLYLQRRNYCTVLPSELTKEQQIYKSSIENASGRSNSILYSCYNSDPSAIDHNFAKFINWLRDQIKNKNRCQDLEAIVGPLFCHMYIDILKGGNIDKAATFFKNHITSIHRNNCDDTVTNLIQLIGSHSEIEEEKEDFRSKKISIELCPQSLSLLKKFMIENCHIVFLQVLQTWFDFTFVEEREVRLDEVTMSDTHSKGPKFKNLLNAIQELKKEPVPIYNVTIACSKNDVNCGLLKRQCGLVAIAENNVVRLMAVHSYDMLLNSDGNNVIAKLTNNEDRIYAMDISPDNVTLATGSADHSVCIYNLADFKLIKKCLGHLGPVYCIKISSNGAFVASGSMDTTVRVWDSCTGKILRIFSGHTQSVTSIVFHPNCLYIASGSADKNVRMWGLNQDTPLRLLHASKGTIYALAFDPSGKFLASASDDTKIRIWNLQNSTVVNELHCKDCKVIRLVWKDEEICAGSVDGIVKWWSLKGLRVDNNWDGSKALDQYRTVVLGGKLLSLEYAFGSYAGLTFKS